MPTCFCLSCRIDIDFCACPQQQLTLPFQIELCTHSQEWLRDTNTGNWLKMISQQVSRHRWHRQLPQQVPAGSVLLYPDDDAVEIQDYPLPINQIWLLDASWQLSRKMLNQSPWLKALPKIKLNSQQLSKSQYTLRRNQQSLCTFEAVSELVKQQGQVANAQKLTDYFLHTQQQYLRSKTH